MERQEMEKALSEIKEIDLKRHYKCNKNEDYVFVSYSSKDKLLVWNIVKSLMDDGFNIFIDKANLNATQEFDRQLMDAASSSHCKYCLFFNSEYSLISSQVQKEMEKARIRNVMNIFIFNQSNFFRPQYQEQLQKAGGEDFYNFNRICENTNGVEKANGLILQEQESYRDFIEMLEFELEENIGIFRNTINKNTDKFIESRENEGNNSFIADSKEIHSDDTIGIQSDKNNKVAVGELINASYFEAHKNDKDLIDNEQKALKFYDEFKSKFSPEKLKELSGLTLLRSIFLNDEGNQTNICSLFEYNKDYIQFGSIKGGTALKHVLYYSAKEKSWMTGKPPITFNKLTEQEAIELGTKIRDNIVKACEIIDKYKDKLNTEEAYEQMYNEIDNQADGIHKVLFVKKYFHMIYKDLFPCMFSTGYIRKIADLFGYEKNLDETKYIAKLEMTKNKHGISNYLFSLIVYKFLDETTGTSSSESKILNY